MPRIVIALGIQLLALGLLAIGVWIAHYVIEPPYPVWVLVGVQGLVAAALSCKLGLPCWWRWIQMALPWGLYAGVTFSLDPLWVLAIFVVLFLVFYNASSEKVPLYLSNATTRHALRGFIENFGSWVKGEKDDGQEDKYGQKDLKGEELMLEKGAILVSEASISSANLSEAKVRFIDLGCGLGGNVVDVAQLPNVVHSVGVETAPLPYLFSKIRTQLFGGEVLRQSLWEVDLGLYDVVYAFLSPEPMPKLWKKVSSEMREGTVFISNSFAFPEVEPTEVWALSDRRRTQLFIYQLGDDGRVQKREPLATSDKRVEDEKK